MGGKKNRLGTCNEARRGRIYIICTEGGERGYESGLQSKMDIRSGWRGLDTGTLSGLAVKAVKRN